MNESARIPRLGELSCIKISVSVWSKPCFQKYMKKETNGIVYLDRALQIIKEAVNKFELCSSIKNSLTEICERVGYELYLFMSESILNTSSPKCFLSENFSNYTVDDINVGIDIKWTLKGEISLTDTLTSYMKNHPNTSPLLIFMCACENCDEYNVILIWHKLSDKQRDQIWKTQCWSKNNLYLNYWLCLLNNNFDNFIRFYGNNMLNFDERRSLNYNLLKYSIMRCFRNNIAYFYSRLTENEKADFIETVTISKNKAVLLHVLKQEAFWYIKYINKFFEVPLLNHDVNKFIITKLSKYSFKELIDYNIQQVNSFGDIHVNIILYLMTVASDEVKVLVFKRFDFYVLSLISKGWLEPVKDLMNEEVKKNILQQILDDFRSLNLGKFLRICMNGHSNLLAQFFDMIADNNDDLLFLKNSLKSINDGTQYEYL